LFLLFFLSQLAVPEKNPGYYVMSDKAKSLILGWLPEDWLLDGSDGMQDIG